MSNKNYNSHILRNSLIFYTTILLTFKLKFWFSCFYLPINVFSHPTKISINTLADNYFLVN